MLLSLSKIKRELLNTIFPKFCVGCGIEGTWLCRNCQKEILPVEMQVCPQCNRINSGGRYCQHCRKGKILKGIIAASYYEEGPIREIIHNFKYNSVTELKDILVKLLFDVYKKAALPIEIITYAPMHPLRQAKRGYNQAEILAMTLAKKIKIPCEKLLIKAKKTKRQVELTGKKRRENLKGVFKVASPWLVGLGPKSIKNKNILIVDDITTTGATLNECAYVLKNAGATGVWGLVVARG